VVWEKRIFLTGGNNQRREVYCFDADSGKLIWQKEVVVGSAIAAKIADDNTLFAAPSPVTDGRYVYAIFGNGDIICLDFEGKTVWARNLGVPENSYGHSASLEIWRNLVLVQLDQASVEDGRSRLLALDSLSGRTVWETSRPPRLQRHSTRPNQAH
jgi:outer membrane protein assembly factor BamB